MEYDEMIAVLQAAKDGKEIERMKFHYSAVTGYVPVGVWEKLPIGDNFNFDSFDYRIKPELTRREITSKWVKDNNIVEGSKVKIVKKSDVSVRWRREEMCELIGKVLEVSEIGEESVRLGVNGFYFEIESLEPYKEWYVQFTWEDRELFRDKWVRIHGCECDESKIIGIDRRGVSFIHGNVDYEKMFKESEFIDGKPFGKLK